MDELDALDLIANVSAHLMVLVCEAAELRQLVDSHERRIGEMLFLVDLITDKLSEDQLARLGIPHH